MSEDWYCPNCSAAWGIEEFDSQTCGCCGYPNVDDFDFDEDDESDEDYEDPDYHRDDIGEWPVEGIS
jgi:hypothetical protein